MLLICHDMKIISDEEFLLLYDANRSEMLNLRYDSYEKINLENMHEDQSITEFRFRKADIPVLAEVLQVPPVIKCAQGSVCNGTKVLCVLLKRLYPCRYSNMIPLFAKPGPVLSMITNEMRSIYDTHGHRIFQWNHTIMSPEKLEEYANTVETKGAPLDNCFGFIDGTVRPISRPDQHQRIVYNGHKRVHALKFQSLVLPNGPIGNIFGPVDVYLTTFRLFLM